MPKFKLALLATVISGLFVLPSIASASVPCDLPTGPVVKDGTVTPGALNDYLTPADAIVKMGTFGPELNGKFVQIPFEIEPGMTGLRMRYCYEVEGPDGQTGGPQGIYNSDNATLDLGLYDPNPSDPGNFTAAQSRGWSGSAVKMIGIGENGFSSPAEYEVNRKAYVPGLTNRGYEPGPIQAGQWAVELGAGFIHPNDDGVDWMVEIIPSTDPNWSDDAFVPDPYTPNVGNPNPGWYTGDVHVHGEQEPGNALVSQTLDRAFSDPPAGSGLDFLTLVDHNNNMSQNFLGSFQAEHPDKVVIPGTEMTTYDGHFNAQGNDPLVDFRLGEIKKFVDANSDDDLDDGELQDVRGIEDPSSRFAAIQAGGGWAQINHPTIFQNAPSSCRGCFWNYSDARTDFSKVNAIEIQTGPAGIYINGLPPFMNPYTSQAIDYYEHALATGAHIAAVGSSDDHDGGEGDASAGHGATVVHADQLSQSAIIAAVKAGHTYVKPFGPDAPDVELTATGADGSTAIPGDSVAAESLAISVKVNGADSGVRPGPFTLAILRDGVQVDSAPVSGAGFTHAFNTTETGRYSFELIRTEGVNPMTEAYSTPVWFTHKDPAITPPPPVEPSNQFRFAGLKLNKKKGTALLKVKVAGAGVVKLAGKNVAKASAKPKKAQIVSLTVRATGKLKKTLRKKHKAIAKTKVTFIPTGGKASTKSKTVKLVLKKKTKKKSKR